MPTPFESAQLNLKLFELRREPVLREARQWFVIEFTPDTFAEFLALASGDRNASFRMVLSYWEMAASLVTAGAIDQASFLAANNEIVATFSKIQPFLKELREVVREPDFCHHLESVIMATPDALDTLTRRRESIRASKAATQKA